MRYFSTFSGIGGFELGIQQAYESNQIRTIKQRGKSSGDNIQRQGVESNNIGRNSRIRDWTCVGYSEIDKYAIQIYQKHFPEHKNYGDITTINASELPDFELLVGGFPCQPFSIAGSRKGFDDTRGILFFDIARIVKEKRPRYLLLENVSGLLSHDNGRTYKVILSTLAKLGYDTEAMVFNSVHFNAAPRKRVYMLAVNREQAPNYWKGKEQATPLYSCCSKGIRNTNSEREPQGVRNAERIIRTFAKLPDWLDSWDTLYGTEESIG